MRVELLAVIGDDARRFLAAMLQRVQAERGQRRRVGVAKDPEDAAFLVEMIRVGAGRSSASAILESAGLGHRDIWRRQRLYFEHVTQLACLSAASRSGGRARAGRRACSSAADRGRGLGGAARRRVGLVSARIARLSASIAGVDVSGCASSAAPALLIFSDSGRTCAASRRPAADRARSWPRAIQPGRSFGGRLTSSSR